MGSSLFARTSSFPRAVDARTQILASRRAHRQRLRRPQSLLLLPAGRRIRELKRSCYDLVLVSRFEDSERAALPPSRFAREQRVNEVHFKTCTSAYNCLRVM